MMAIIYEDTTSHNNSIFDTRHDADDADAYATSRRRTDERSAAVAAQI